MSNLVTKTFRSSPIKPVNATKFPQLSHSNSGNTKSTPWLPAPSHLSAKTEDKNHWSDRITQNMSQTSYNRHKSAQFPKSSQNLSDPHQIRKSTAKISTDYYNRSETLITHESTEADRRNKHKYMKISRERERLNLKKYPKTRRELVKLRRKSSQNVGL